MIGGRFRRRLFELLEGRSHDRRARIVAGALMALIMVNVAAIVLESEEPLSRQHEGFFRWFELVSVAIFTVEYVCRVWTCTEAPEFRRGFGRLRFLLTPLALIDLAAIAPFYLSAALIDLRILRTLRLVRLMRVFKLGRYSEALATLKRVFVAKKEELTVSVLVVLLLMLLGSGLMYMVEREAQPEAFSSIPAALWWASVTLSTVNYVDVHPVTPTGRVLGVLLALLDLALLAVPTGILGSGFVEEFQSTRAGQSGRCPRCGASWGGDTSLPRRAPPALMGDAQDVDR